MGSTAWELVKVDSDRRQIYDVVVMCQLFGDLDPWSN